MKSFIFAAVAALAITPAFAGEQGGNGNGSKAQAGAIAGALNNTQIEFADHPQFTYGVFGQIGSSNNSPCGRTFFGIPASGENCTARMEAQAIYNATLPMLGERAASRAATMHLARMDKTMRDTLIAAGVVRLAD